MILKKYRLTTPQVQWLLRRWQRVSGKKFLFLTQAQTKNMYSQRAFQLPVKVDKRAVMRNMCKRAFYDIALATETKGTHTRTFVCLHKDALQEVIQLIASGDKTTILAQWKAWCTQDLHYFFARRWTVISSIDKKSATPHVRGWHIWSKGNPKAIKK